MACKKLCWERWVIVHRCSSITVNRSRFLSWSTPGLEPLWKHFNGNPGLCLVPPTVQAPALVWNYKLEFSWWLETKLGKTGNWAEEICTGLLSVGTICPLTASKIWTWKCKEKAKEVVYEILEIKQEDGEAQEEVGNVHLWTDAVGQIVGQTRELSSSAQGKMSP